MAKGKHTNPISLTISNIKVFLKKPVIQKLIIVYVAILVGINLSVSIIGKSHSFIFSPAHLWNKSQALILYAQHKQNNITAPSSTTTVKQALHQATRKYKINQKFAFAIAKAESDFIPTRISNTGAMGVMQLMPETAKELGVEDPFDPIQNVDGGVKYLSRLSKKYKGNLKRIAAAYNYGPGRVPKFGPYTIPKETQHYVKRVIRFTRQF